MSYAAYEALRAFFGGDTPITIDTFIPTRGPVSTSPRTYAKFHDIEKEIVDARMLGGMHFRYSRWKYPAAELINNLSPPQ